MTKRMLSLLLALVMTLSLCVPALAADEFEAETVTEVEEQAPEAPVEPEAPEAEVVEEPVEEPETAAVIEEPIEDEPAVIAVNPVDDEIKSDFIETYETIKTYVDGFETKEYRLAEGGGSPNTKATLKTAMDEAAKIYAYLTTGKDEGGINIGDDSVEQSTNTLKSYLLDHIYDEPENGKISNRPIKSTQESKLTGNNVVVGLLGDYNALGGNSATDAQIKKDIAANKIADSGKDAKVTWYRPGFFQGLQDVAAEILAAKEKLDTDYSKESGYLTYKEATEIIEKAEKWASGTGEEYKKATTPNFNDYETIRANKAAADTLKAAKDADTAGKYTEDSKTAFQTAYEVAETQYNNVVDLVNGGLKNVNYHTWCEANAALVALTATGEDAVLKENEITGKIINITVAAGLANLNVTFAKGDNDDHDYAYSYTVNGVECKTANGKTSYTDVTFNGAMQVKALDNNSENKGTAFEKNNVITITLYVKGGTTDKPTYTNPVSASYTVPYDGYDGPMFAVNAKGEKEVEWGKEANHFTATLDRVKADSSVKFILTSPNGTAYESDAKTPTATTWNFGDIMNSAKNAAGKTVSDTLVAGDWTVELRVAAKDSKDYYKRDTATVTVPNITEYGKPAEGAEIPTESAKANGYLKLTLLVAEMKEVVAGDYVSKRSDMTADQAKKLLQEQIDKAETYIAAASTKANTTTEQTSGVEALITALTKYGANLAEAADPTPVEELIAKAEALVETDYSAGWSNLETKLKAAKTAIEKPVASQGDADEDGVDTAFETVYNELDAAITGLKAKALNLLALNEAIAKAEKLNKEDYYEDSWKAVETALATAKATKTAAGKTKDKPLQSKVDADTKALNDAIDVLVSVEMGEAKKALEEALADAEAVDKTKYTDASVAVLEAAVKAADDLADDATAAQVKAAADGIQAAIKALVAKNTPKDTWQKDADGDYHYYDKNGVEAKGWVFSGSKHGLWYYTDPTTGKLATGFTQVKDPKEPQYDGWYYFTPSGDCIGAVTSGWQNVPGYGWSWFETRHNGHWGACTYTSTQGDYVNYQPKA